jgi:hypothetical protein
MPTHQVRQQPLSMHSIFWVHAAVHHLQTAQTRVDCSDMPVHTGALSLNASQQTSRRDKRRPDGLNLSATSPYTAQNVAQWLKAVKKMHVCIMQRILPKHLTCHATQWEENHTRRVPLLQAERRRVTPELPQHKSCRHIA